MVGHVEAKFGRLAEQDGGHVGGETAADAVLVIGAGGLIDGQDGRYEGRQRIQ